MEWAEKKCRINIRGLSTINGTDESSNNDVSFAPWNTLFYVRIHAPMNDDDDVEFRQDGWGRFGERVNGEID